jgi:hypothetical protein
MTLTPNANITTPRMTANFLVLAPEIRNAIYDLVFEPSSPFFIVVAEGNRSAFWLRARSDKHQDDVVRALEALSLVHQDIRREVRIFFYASRQFIILPHDYEYLPIFVRWLDARSDSTVELSCARSASLDICGIDKTFSSLYNSMTCSGSVQVFER